MTNDKRLREILVKIGQRAEEEATIFEALAFLAEGMEQAICLACAEEKRAHARRVETIYIAGLMPELPSWVNEKQLKNFP